MIQRYSEIIVNCYLKNTPAKFRPDPIWNDKALDFLKRSPQQQQQQQQQRKTNSDMRSVADLKYT